MSALDRQLKILAQKFSKPHNKASRVRSVDHPVVVRERKRQHQSFVNFSVNDFQLGPAARHAQDADFRVVDDRRERCAADATEVGDREAGTLHFAKLDSAITSPHRDVGQTRRDFRNALLIAVPNDRNEQPVRRVDGASNVEIFAVDKFVCLRVESGVELWKLFAIFSR